MTIIIILIFPLSLRLCFPLTLISLNLLQKKGGSSKNFYCIFFVFRSNVSSQTPSAKRSLGFLPQPAPLSVKKLRCNQDYTGWNKPRVPLSSHQQQLQGLVNLLFYRVIQLSYSPFVVDINIMLHNINRYVICNT